MRYLKQGLIFALACSSVLGFAMDVGALEHDAEKTIKTIYHNQNNKQNANVTQRIIWMSAQFLGKPYLLGALGEGSQARFDQFPLYRTDAFDCETYVDTVVAAALADNFESFQKEILKIRYKAGKATYASRNHFTDLDWNLNNQQQGIVKDITKEFKNKEGKSIALMAEAIIDKPSWYAMRPLEAIRLEKQDELERKTRHVELMQEGKQFKTTKVRIPYLPLSVLFDEKGNPNQAVFSKIPQAAIIEIIRPNWNLKTLIGTNLNVSHLGFAIWKNNTLYFRQASSENGAVVDVPLIEYLHKAKSSPTIKGINVQVVL
jgi:hypothetical protein